MTRIAALVAVACLMGSVLADFQGSTHLMPYDEDTINYNKTTDTSPIARLQKKLDSGEVKFVFDPKHGYLPALLKALDVPVASQMLVFSKTSFQRERIDPKHPRGIYFGDDVYIGYVTGSPMLEITGVDKKLGGVFYTLAQKEVERPKFERNDQCLECHASAKSMGVPGHLIRSFATDESGVVDLSSGTSLVNHRTPLEERWGGWYVTGTHGDQTHRGNLVGKADFARQGTEPNFRGNVTDLSSFCDISKYPEKSSDIVALMVLEHQTHMHNFITRLNYEATIALQQYGHVRYLKNSTDAFVKYLLFVEEAPISSGISGNPAFVKAFEARGPTDRQGRSLRQLNLQSRLFKYPCSYLIYSEAFDELPGPVKEVIYQKLWDVLTGKDDRPVFSVLDEPTRNAIRDILIDTKKDLPAYWTRDRASGKQS